MTLAAVVGLAGMLHANVPPSTEEVAEGIVQRLLAQTSRLGVAARAIRDLRAGTLSGKHHGWMEVETTQTPTGFTWRVLDEGGSARTRDKVFRALLQAESESCRAGERDRAALSPENYDFVPLSGARAGQVKIQLKPRRADSILINGVLTATTDGHPLVLEGRLAKSPSFWVKSVNIVKRFSRIAGVSLPVTVESTADLRMFGQSTFTMQYRYTEVNGRSVSQAVASAASAIGPSIPER